MPPAATGQLSGLTAVSAVYVGLACLVVGEMPAWVSTRLQLERVAAWRYRAAVNDIGAGLASAADPEALWS